MLRTGAYESKGARKVGGQAGMVVRAGESLRISTKGRLKNRQNADPMDSRACSVLWCGGSDEQVADHKSCQATPLGQELSHLHLKYFLPHAYTRQLPFSFRRGSCHESARKRQENLR